MGPCISRTDDASKKSILIDQELRTHEQSIHNQVKMLLLGPGESGKSTVFKQMKIIQDKGGFSREESLHFRSVIYSNCISQMKVLITAASNLQVSFSTKESCEAAEKLLELHQQGVTMSEEIAKIIHLLWIDKAIQTVYEMKGRAFQLNDTAEYFFTNIDRIAKEDYVPTHEDILRARVRSTGIEEAQFTFEMLTFTLVDVGGQRAERRKWIHCFGKVNVVLFCAAISAYDQTLREERTQNRIIEAIMLFDEVTNSSYFSKKVAFILFLNKTDLFQEKYSKVPLNVCFPDYTGTTIEEAKQYIEFQFREKLQENQPIFVHHTCALDTQNIRFVITAIRKEILKKVVEEFILVDNVL
jgi:GTPase SAR1 family protein